ncbi:MAG: hypothetical protein GY757_01710 [bacterium]|nr:hypothetical protein [bacterium]
MQSSGIGSVTLTTPSAFYPVGANDIPIRITNSDTRPGHIAITINVTGTLNKSFAGSRGRSHSVSVSKEPLASGGSVTKTYYLEAGQSTDDVIQTDFTEKGEYTLSVTGPKLSVPLTAAIRVVNVTDISATLSVGAPAANHIPVEVSISNNGSYDYSGTLVTEIGDFAYEEPVATAAGGTLNKIIPFETAALSPGTKEVKVILYDTSGTKVAEASAPAVITAADIKIIEFPSDLEIIAGSYSPVTLKLKNEGHLRGEALLKITVFDSVSREREIGLDPGEEIEVENILIDAPADLPTGTYPFNYTKPVMRKTWLLKRFCLMGPKPTAMTRNRKRVTS